MAKRKKYSWVSWSEDEVRLLKRLFPLGRAREVAEQTGRPLTAVGQKAYSMGIKTREWRLWSANEIKLLKKLYPSENTQSIADKLGRSSEAVRVKQISSASKKWEQVLFGQSKRKLCLGKCIQIIAHGI